MGMLIHGKWEKGGWKCDKRGRFLRDPTHFHQEVSREKGARHAPEPGRYHLYVSFACPWAHRTLIFRKLKKLEGVISLSVVDPLMTDEGWQFSENPGCIPDPILGAKYLREIYLKTDAKITTRVTVPVLWDKKEKTIVNNESREIINMLDSEFDEWGDPDIKFFPEDQRGLIDRRIDEIYEPINNGVYRSGFAKTQEAYEEAVRDLFAALDKMEAILQRQPYLCGENITAADWCLFTTLIRFDLVYYFHFKCNIKRILDYPYLWHYLQRLYHIPGVSETCHFGHIKNHYYWSHESVNPHRIVPLGPDLHWVEAHGPSTPYRGKYLNLHQQNGWEYVERNNCEGAVFLVPVTDEGKVILIEQYRVPLKKRVIEFPAGLVNDRPGQRGEEWEKAARRELIEETGYEPGELTFLSRGPSSPGMSTEVVALYLAKKLKKVGPGGGDSHEDIVVHEVPLGQLEQWLKEQEAKGHPVDPKVYSGLFFLRSSIKTSES